MSLKCSEANFSRSLAVAPEERTRGYSMNSFQDEYKKWTLQVRCKGIYARTVVLKKIAIEAGADELVTLVIDNPLSSRYPPKRYGKERP